VLLPVVRIRIESNISGQQEIVIMDAIITRFTIIPENVEAVGSSPAQIETTSPLTPPASYKRSVFPVSVGTVAGTKMETEEHLVSPNLALRYLP
jgi:hypothetical protein